MENNWSILVVKMSHFVNFWTSFGLGLKI